MLSNHPAMWTRIAALVWCVSTAGAGNLTNVRPTTTALPLTHSVSMGAVSRLLVKATMIVRVQPMCAEPIAAFHLNSVATAGLKKPATRRLCSALKRRLLV